MTELSTIYWRRYEPIELALDEQTCVAASDPYSETPAELGDAAESVQQALREPLDFPALAAATVEGDRVAVAIPPHLPQLASVVRGVVAALRASGIDAASTSFVVASQRDAVAVGQAVGDTEFRVVLHDPSDSDALCYIGEMRGDVTLRLNRTLAEADFVLPVGCTHRRQGQGSPFEDLFPLFSDSESQQRYAAIDPDAPGDLQRRRDEAGWMLGAALVLQVVPGHRGQVAGVVAGTPQGCHAAARDLARTVWHRQFARAARLVVASAAGDSPVDWQQWADMIVLADSLREPGGAIALCVELPPRPGKSLRRLMSTSDLRDVARQVARDHHDDTHVAAVLLDAIERGPVFLLSNWNGDLVEDLGMAPIADGDELQRLVQRMGDCIVIDEAHLTTASIAPPVVAGDME
jgi:nickel-dependent lactate racemase